MTKLFSVKSLAFAGAAAFALTLAAAPQADAAEATTITNLSVSYDTVRITTDGSLPSTEDGGIIYYQVAKEKGKIKENKYKAISTHGHEEMGNVYEYSFDKFIRGKQTYLSFSLDGVKETTGAAIKAAPKTKVKYKATDGFTFSVNGGTFVRPVTDAAVNSGNTLFVTGGDGKKYALDYNYHSLDDVDDVSWYLNFGGSKYFSLHEIDPNPADGIALYSTGGSAKVSAQPKAPKVSLKLDAAKAFTWKLSDKQEYMIENVDADTDKKSGWKKGSKAADSWEKIIKDVKSDWADATKPANIVSGDAITSDINISVRTAAGQKVASAINLIKLKKSAASPTDSAVTVETTKATYKPNGKVQKATGAAIKAVKDIQYSVDDGKKWKKVRANGTAKLKDTDKTVLVRIAGQSKKGFVLPSLNTKIETDFATGKATISSIDYDTDGFKVETKTVEAK